MTWISQHIDALRDALRRLMRSPLSSLSTALAVGVAITLPASLYLGLKNLNHLAGDIPTQPEISVFISTQASQSQRNSLKEKLQQHQGLGKLRFVSKDEALARLNQQGLADLTAGLGKNPLPDAWVLTPATSSPAEIAMLRQQLAAMSGVESVLADNAWAERMQAILKIGGRVVFSLAALFGLALAAIAGNAVRAQLLARRDEIRVSWLIGATDRYIKRPFLYHGAFQGALGSLATLGILSVLGLALYEPVSQLANLYGSPFRLMPLNPVEVAVIAGGPVVLSWLGAWLAVGHTLKRIEHY